MTIAINAQNRFGSPRLRTLGLTSLLVAVTTLPAGAGLVNLDLRLPAGPNYLINQNIPVELWFVGTTSPGVEWDSADVIFEWDSTVSYVSFDDQPVPDMMAGTFPKAPPQDGIGWSGFTLGSPIMAASGLGTHVTTLNLKATAIGTALITIIEQDNLGPTVVLDNMSEITGTLDEVEVVICMPEPASAVLLLPLMLMGLGRGRRRS